MENKVKYVFQQFQNIYHFDRWSEISYGLDAKSSIQIAKGNISFFNNKDPFPGKTEWVEWKERQIPFLFDEFQEEVISFDSGKVIINLDIISGAFYFLSGWQEYFSDKRDDIGRFPYHESIQYKLGIVEIPVVNYYFDILKFAIEKGLGITLKAQLWGDKNVAVFLSHDIDKVNSGWLEGGYSELRKGKWLSALKLAIAKLSGQDAWFNLEEIVELEKKYNAVSTFYFLTKKGKYLGVLNADYEIKNSKIQNVIQRIKTAGWEVGVHGSYGSAFEKEKLGEEIKKLSVRVKSNRFHFLSWEQKLTPKILQEYRIDYDSTLGFPEHFGFRNGICHPFHLFDIEKDKPLDVIEIPLNLMDTTFQQKEYLDFPRNEIITVFARLLDEVQQFDGCLSVLWHNNFFSSYKYDGWKDVYIEILDKCKKENVSFESFTYPKCD